MSGEDTREALTNYAETVWKPLGGHPLGCGCALCVTARNFTPNLEAADHLAAPVGEQEQAMPPIEVGDWVFHAWLGTPKVLQVDAMAMAFMADNDMDQVFEIRKADGRVWRRNG